MRRNGNRAVTARLFCRAFPPEERGVGLVIKARNLPPREQARLRALLGGYELLLVSFLSIVATGALWIALWLTGRLDMFLPGLIAYKSVFAGNKPLEIPDLRTKEARDKYRNDVWCVDPKVAGKDAVPSYSKGNPVIADSVYEKVAEMYRKECEQAENKA